VTSWSPFFFVAVFIANIISITSYAGLNREFIKQGVTETDMGGGIMLRTAKTLSAGWAFQILIFVTSCASMVANKRWIRYAKGELARQNEAKNTGAHSV
jgi:hypothetical protein